MSILCAIPARGGSKRFPGKNVVDFGGKPIIACSIEAARACAIFERVVVTTDDPEIARAGRRHGATIDDRPPELAGDDVGVDAVCLDLLEREARAGRHYEILCCLYATAPLRNEEDILAVVDLVRSGKHDFAMAVTRFDLPPYQALIRDEAGALVPMWPELVARQSQELPEFLVDNGSTYAGRVSAYLRHRTFYGPGLGGYVMPRIRSVDIDRPEDLDEALWNARRLRCRGS